MFQSISNYANELINYIVSVRRNILYIVLIIMWLTFMQKYHYKMLNQMRFQTKWFFGKFISWVIRFWVIIHEFSHLFFGRIFGARVHKLDLFSETWWQVVFSQQDYIWAIWSNHWNWFIFLIKLLINRFWTFLSSLGPLIVWIFLNILILNYFTWNPIWSFQANINLDNFQISVFSIIFLIIYLIVFMPSFILSRQDISNFFFYRWDNIFARFIWSFINLLTFIIFLIIIAKFFDYILFFWMFYIYSFILALFSRWLYKIVMKIIKPRPQITQDYHWFKWL